MSNPHYLHGSRIPFPMYLTLLNAFPKLSSTETDRQWLRRISQNRMFHRRYEQELTKHRFNVEIRNAVHMRWLMLAGAQRKDRAAGHHLVNVRTPGSQNVKQTVATRYQRELLDNNGNFRFADEALDLVVAEFDPSTPNNGSIFWNGIDECKLAKLVDQWNTQMGAEIYGQLEATTLVRYLNGRFEWEPNFANYITRASAELGKAARGHVTSVVRCGLRDTSVFTTTELPAMLARMKNQLRARQDPEVTDISIVVIEPKTFEERPVKVFTNDEITMIPIISRAQGSQFINGRSDCVVKGRLDLDVRVREHFAGRPDTKPSTAAIKIMKDFKNMLHGP
ncbi:hypothetical protein AB1L42_12580 [Thalassoglobus sp. JC818]|uniref:hypothetical protein n=1 Tax=Thalassoglobus sp. JC818 TaxID=3232136 RepID=UPI0034592B41